VSYAVVSGEDSLDDLHDRLMLLRQFGSSSGFIVCGRDIREQVAHVRFTEDFEVGQSKEEGLADA